MKPLSVETIHNDKEVNVCVTETTKKQMLKKQQQQKKIPSQTISQQFYAWLTWFIHIYAGASLDFVFGFVCTPE